MTMFILGVLVGLMAASIFILIFGQRINAIMHIDKDSGTYRFTILDPIDEWGKRKYLRVKVDSEWNSKEENNS